MKTLRMAPSLALPVHAVTESIGILAKRRAGKSTTARRLTEQLAHAHQQVVVIDPKGDWWGLRSSRDGKSEGLPFVIMGGEHHDVPLEVGGGELVARLVVTDRVSVILDLSEFRRDDRDQFITAFMETLYRMKAQEKFRTPVMLIIDEADLIAPQKLNGRYSADMAGAATDLVRRGGQRGIGVTMISQRSASINKDVLTQLGILIILQTIAPQDRKAIEAWVDVHGTPAQAAELMASLPTLDKGNGWIWAPGFPEGEGLFERHQFLLPETFDSSATPTAGKRPIEPRKAAKVDLDAFRREMAQTIKAQEDNDPKRLRGRIAQLERELTIERAKDPSKAYSPLKAQHVRRLEDCSKMFFKAIARVEKATNEVVVGLSKAMPAEPGRLLPDAAAAAIEQAGASALRHLQAATGGVSEPARPRDLTPADEWVNSTGINAGERAILTAIAQESMVTPEQLAVMVPTLKRSSRNQYLRRLYFKELIVGRGKEGLRATAKGIRALGPGFRPTPTAPADLRAHLLTTLPYGEKSILEILIRHFPAAVDSDRIKDATGYKRSSANQYLRKLMARKAVERINAGTYKAAASLFGGAR